MLEGAKVMWKNKTACVAIRGPITISKGSDFGLPSKSGVPVPRLIQIQQTMKGQEDLICMFVYQSVFIYVQVFVACLSEEVSALM